MKILTLPILSILLLVSAQVGASLIDRGNGLIYDDVLDLTWLQAKVPNNNGVWTFNFLNGRHPQDDK
jgi:hypothetical protein